MKPKIRKLSEIEKQINESAIIRFTEKNNELNYLLEDALLKYTKGLDYSYKKQKREYAEAIQEMQREKENNTAQISILKQQIDKGVEVKNNEEEKTYTG